MLGAAVTWNISNVGAIASVMGASYGVSLAAVGLLTTGLFATHLAVQIPGGRLILAPLVIAAYLASRFARRLWQPDFRGIARCIERQHPELHALLITAVEQKPSSAVQRTPVSSFVAWARPREALPNAPE